MNNKIKLGKYQHYKNKKMYEVIGVALHSETQKEMVVYKALYKCEKFGDFRLWVRPSEMFLEEVEYEEKYMSRFIFVEEE
jgi:hypothetical protein